MNDPTCCQFFFPPTSCPWCVPCCVPYFDLCCSWEGSSSPERSVFPINSQSIVGRTRSGTSWGILESFLGFVGRSVGLSLPPLSCIQQHVLFFSPLKRRPFHFGMKGIVLSVCAAARLRPFLLEPNLPKPN
eukprot:EG_transcript_40180